MSKFVAVTEYDPELRYTSINATRKMHLALGKAVIDAEAVTAARFVERTEIDQNSFVEIVVPGISIVVTSEDAVSIIGKDAVDALLG